MNIFDWLAPARQIAPEWRQEFDQELAWVLFVRMRAIAVALALFNGLILAFVDLPRVDHANRGQQILCGLHAAMLVVCLAILLLGLIRRPSNATTLAPWHRIASATLPAASLLWGAAIAVNAQLLHHEITAYIAALLVVVVSAPLSPLRSFIMIGASFASFAAGLLLLPVPSFTRESHFLNSSATVVVAWVLSTLLFGSRVRDFLNRHTIARQRAELDTARQREEEQRISMKRLESQRLESLGLLAGGVAHDFNNLLQAIRSNISLALSPDSDAPATRAALDDAQTAVQRASELANQMLAYSGRGLFVVEPVDLSELVSEMARLAASSVPKKCALQLDLADNLPPIDADVAQLRQVVLNLITNAAEATGDASGHVVVRTSVRDYIEAELGQGPLSGLPAGRYVTLTVKDDGCGMTAEVLSHIFDPFFSTKFTGRGLGMAAVLGILRGHHGTIQIESRPGLGSTFQVLLPVSTSPARARARARSERQDTAYVGRGRILVVDDEELLRRGTMRFLAKAGFEVTVAGDGEEGLAAFRAPDQHFDAVVVDLSMPGMDGLQVIRELRTLQPDVSVILTSGYSASDLAGRLQGGAGTSPDLFLQKPYSPGLLVQELRRLIHAHDGSPG